MDTVTSWNQILHNLKVLEAYRTSQDGEDRAYYKSRIRLGKCFVVFDLQGQPLFGPSRFLGYVNNDRYKHEANPNKHGWIANKAINNILGRCIPDKIVEEKYLRFCDQHGIRPAMKKRKYWLVGPT